MVTGSQIRAARGLLDWTRDKLAQASGLTAAAIKNIENDPDVRPHHKTVEILTDILAQHGVELTERDGVRRTDDTVKVLEGENAYLRMLDDIYYVMQKKSGEVLFFCSDDRSARAGEIEAEERIRSNGTRFRCLIEAGNDVIRWPRAEYRQIPSDYFNHDLQVIYGDKVAQLIDGGTKILIISNASLAQTERNKFNLLWPAMRQLSKPSGAKDGKRRR